MGKVMFSQASVCPQGGMVHPSHNAMTRGVHPGGGGEYGGG